jgi:hypothetical protein
MKRFVLWAVVPAFIALGATAYYAVPLHPRYAPAIKVAMNGESSGGADYLPAVNGYVSGRGGSTYSEGAKEIYHVDETYKVISTAKGHFTVMAHYVIERDGLLTSVDRMLPVWDKCPDQSKWSKLDNHLVAYACLSESTIRY